MITKLDRFEGCMLGLACGDAVGTTVEFNRRGTFPPVTDMVGGGAFDLEPGQWTDDTSMALCLAVSLTQKKRFDAHDIMERFCKWRDEGYLSSNGHCFDIGGTVGRALNKFKRTCNPYAGDTDPKTAGNGCLMRLAPVVMMYHGCRTMALRMASNSAALTHGATECLIASQAFGDQIWMALDGASKNNIVTSKGGFGWDVEASRKITNIANGSYRGIVEKYINGIGYVVDSLEAALWCFHRTSTFKDAILMAANLGDDADTTAAITGQIAGAFYGVNGIPPEWLEMLAMSDYIRQMGGRLMRLGEQL